MTETTKKVFRNMLDLLESKKIKWIQKKLATNDSGISTNTSEATCMCLAGLIHRSIMDLGIDDKGNLDIHVEIFRTLRGKCGDVVIWNDAPNRTEEDVINLLKEVAA